ncbi:MAG: hypothetical protein KatS3mg102_1548 [Planctomycetota bacterium]|nr:MAG: hypothetical protein KatS3mg102_1548 [Planctomycetota bacterium]
MAAEPGPAAVANPAAAPPAPLAASVIVVARDRAAQLAAALASLRAQRLTAGRFEIIAVDDGSRDETWPSLCAQAARPSDAALPPLQIVRNDRSLGPGLARNRGAARARGAVLVFLDSDCRALAGWLEALLAPLAEPAVGAVGGAEALDPEQGLLGRLFHFALTSPLSTGRLRGGTGWRLGRYRPRGYSMAVRRELFVRLGGFAGLRHGEDLELVGRIERAGYRCVHAPAARVLHRRRQSLAGFARQLFAMGRARSTLLRRDRTHAEPVYFVPALLLLGVLALGLAGALVPGAREAVVGWALVPAGLYGALLGLAAVRALGRPAAAVLAPLVVAVQQLCYGAGLFWGLVAPWREEQPFGPRAPLPRCSRGLPASGPAPARERHPPLP